MSRRYTSTSGRRGGTVAGSLGLVLAATLLPAAPAWAVEGDALPAGDWGTCADAADQYCVAELTVVPLGDGAASTLTASAVTVPDEYVPSFDWSIDGWAAQSTAVRNGAVTLVLRTGRFVPRFTSAVAKDMHVSRVADEDGNYTMTVTGHAVHVDWTTGEHAAECAARQYCGEYDQTADAAGTGLRLQGSTQDTGEGDVAMDGAYVATGAQARTGGLGYNIDPEPSLWFGVLGNPQLDVNGQPVRGSLNAWVPGAYFETVAGTTPEAAVATGFDLVSEGDGMSASVPVAAAVRGGGVAFDVADIAYPTAINMLQVYHRPSGAADGDTAPGSPQQVSGLADVEGLVVNWAAPASDGGSPVVGYRARVYAAATGGTALNRCDGDAAGTSCAIYGLDEGTTVYVTASAFSALGEGPASARVPVSVGDPVTAPSPPRSVKSVPGPRRLTVSWTAPLHDGGAEVTEYAVRVYRAATGGTLVKECATDTLTCVFDGLTGGAHYVEVLAANSAAWSEPSAPRVAATPWTVAGAPRSITARSAKSKITVGWAAPASVGGTAVTKYEARLYTVAKGGTPAVRCTATGAARTCLSATLKPGRVYYASVVAVNAAGRSVESARVKVLVKR